MVVTLGHAEVDGVQSHLVQTQGVDVARTIQAGLDGRCHVEEQILEIDFLAGYEEGYYGIVALALDMHLHGGQQTADGRLVDDALLELVGDRVA